MTTDQEMREYADKAARSVYIAPTADAGYWRLTADRETKTLMQKSLRWVPGALDRLDRIRALIDPSKAVKGSVASKILQILDGDDQ